MLARDISQLIFWAVFGLFTSWGIFLSFVGFRQVPDYEHRRLAKTAATISLVVGIIWVMLWVSACIFNFAQIMGEW